MGVGVPTMPVFMSVTMDHHMEVRGFDRTMRRTQTGGRLIFAR